MQTNLKEKFERLNTVKLYVWEAQTANLTNIWRQNWKEAFMHTSTSLIRSLQIHRTKNKKHQTSLWMTEQQKIVRKLPPFLPFSHRYNVSGLLAFHMHVIVTEYSFISTLVPYQCADDSHYSFICSDHMIQTIIIIVIMIIKLILLSIAARLG